MYYITRVRKDGANVMDTSDGVVEPLREDQLRIALNGGLCIEGLRFNPINSFKVDVKAVSKDFLSLLSLEQGTPFRFKTKTMCWTQAVYAGQDFDFDSNSIRFSFIVRDKMMSRGVAVMRLTGKQIIFGDIDFKVRLNDNEPCDVVMINKMVRQAGGLYAF